jgi:hypothetical protein
MNLIQVFSIKYGQKSLHNKENLDDGNSLVISSQATDNGCYGFFDTMPKYKPPFITVPSTGSIGEAFVQIYPCAVCDDNLVLEPRQKLPLEYFFYIAFRVRTQKWRYNYGRKITPNRLATLAVIPPEAFKLDISYKNLTSSLYPRKAYHPYDLEYPLNIRIFPVDKLFDTQRGHFHAIDRLESGIYATVSRASSDNGIVGFYNKPSKAKVFPKDIITVSTVSGDAFVQQTPFIATDNVVMCIPKRPLRISTLLYIVTLLNKVKWRYSYGRQCYKGNFQKTSLSLPIIKDDIIDEDYIEKLVTTLPYWDEYKARCLG